MPSMYPGMTPHPEDLNRATPVATEGDIPSSLRSAYVATIISAAFLLVAGLIIATHGVPADAREDALPELLDAVRRNMLIVGIGNIIGAVAITIAVASVRKGSRTARRVFVAIAAVLVFLNLGAILLHFGGIGLTIGVVGILISVMLAYRPASNAYVNLISGTRYDR